MGVTNSNGFAEARRLLEDKIAAFPRTAPIFASSLGGSEREYGLGARVRPVVRRLVAIEEDPTAEWYRSEDLYRLLKGGVA